MRRLAAAARYLDRFAGLLVCAILSPLRRRAVTLPCLYLDLLAPAARWLGTAWEEDRADFSTVTLGLMRLQHMVRDYDDALTRDVRPQARPRRPLACPAAQTTHWYA